MNNYPIFSVDPYGEGLYDWIFTTALDAGMEPSEAASYANELLTKVQEEI